MTCDEHMHLKHAIQDVLDELHDRFRRDERIQLQMAKLEDCLAVLQRPSVLQVLTDEDEQPIRRVARGRGC
jgi:hypothetical protein